jgi:hypothetical protein
MASIYKTSEGVICSVHLLLLRLYFRQVRLLLFCSEECALPKLTSTRRAFARVPKNPEDNFVEADVDQHVTPKEPDNTDSYDREKESDTVEVTSILNNYISTSKGYRKLYFHHKSSVILNLAKESSTTHFDLFRHNQQMIMTATVRIYYQSFTILSIQAITMKLRSRHQQCNYWYLSRRMTIPVIESLTVNLYLVLQNCCHRRVPGDVINKKKWKNRKTKLKSWLLLY